RNVADLPIRGVWRGRCTVHEQTMNVELIVTQENDGKVLGTWAGTPIKGDRLGRETFFFEVSGKHEKYKVVAVMDAGRMMLKFASMTLAGGGRTYGGGTLLQACRWEKLPGSAKHIAVGADGSAWMIVTDVVGGGVAGDRW